MDAEEIRRLYLTVDAREAIPSSMRVVSKDHWFWRLLGTLIGIFADKQLFLERFVTTIGPVVAVPPQWLSSLQSEVPNIGHLRVLLHEARHIQQFRWFGLGIHPWVGVLPMALVYLLFPLPAGLAWGRYALEGDALKQELLLSRKEKLVQHPRVAFQTARHFAQQVSGPMYGYAWPKSWCEMGYENRAAAAEAEFEDWARVLP